MAVTIVVMVSVIVYPKFRSGRDYAKWQQCTGNIRQLGIAIGQYEQDNEMRLPPATTGQSSWRRTVSPYVMPTEKCVCLNNPAHTLPDAEHDGNFRSYSVNASSGGKKGIGGPFNPAHPSLHVDRFESPSRTILLVESTSALATFDPLLPSVFAQPTGNTVGHLFNCYNLQANALYGDLHVGKRPLTSIDGMNPWTIDGSAFNAQDEATAKSTAAFAATQDHPMDWY